MVDVWGVVSSGLWIIGLAFLLAVLSRAHWSAAKERVRFAAVWARPDVQRALYAGAILVSAGLACTSRVWWERTVWIVVAVVSAVKVRRGGRRPV